MHGIRITRSSSVGPLGGCIAVALGSGFAAFFYFGVWAAFAALLGIWTRHNIDFWASHVQHHAVHVPFWVAWLASIPLPFTFIANIVSEIAKFFV